MNSLNKVQLIGNTTNDIEVRETPSGQKVASFSLATNRTWKDSNGEKQEQVEFHSIVVWGKLAEIVEQYLKKGRKAYIEGRLQTKSWEDQAGNKRYKTEIVADNIILLSQKQKEEQESIPEFETEKPKSLAQKKADQATEIDIDSIPF